MTQLSPHLDNFFQKVQPQIEATLRQVITPKSDSILNLDDGIAYALGLDDEKANAGKRIRPILSLLVCDSLSNSYEAALPFAAAIELMHNFALVHDDIEDGDEFRRGRPSVWVKYGVPHAINIGDYLFTKIYEALLINRDKLPADRIVKLFDLMTNTLDHTHRGQALDMNARIGRITEDEYMNLVKEKTGYYLAAPLLAGAIAAGAEDSVLDALNSFGQHIGPLFQIKDDVIDLTHGKGRETIGSDIKEGKRSYLVAYAFGNATAENQKEIEAILDLPRNETTDQHIATMLDIFQKCGAMSAAQEKMNFLENGAKSALDKLPEPLRSRLHEITDYLVSRTT